MYFKCTSSQVLCSAVIVFTFAHVMVPLARAMGCDFSEHICTEHILYHITPLLLISMEGEGEMPKKSVCLS